MDDLKDLEALKAELLDLALEAASRAGALLRDGRPEDLGVAATKSSSVDVVTEMDLAAEKLITEMDGMTPVRKWVKKRERNEALDCRVLAMAALDVAAGRCALLEGRDDLEEVVAGRTDDIDQAPLGDAGIAKGDLDAQDVAQFLARAFEVLGNEDALPELHRHRVPPIP